LAIKLQTVLLGRPDRAQTWTCYKGSCAVQLTLTRNLL
jgi:hypothetical protein